MFAGKLAAQEIIVLNGIAVQVPPVPGKQSDFICQPDAQLFIPLFDLVVSLPRILNGFILIKLLFFPQVPKSVPDLFPPFQPLKGNFPLTEEREELREEHFL